MPDIQAASDTAPAVPPPAMHPMDPRRGENLSPRFAAVLCWLMQLPPMTAPAITGIVVSGDCVFAATTDDPFFNTLIGSGTDVDANLRGWGGVCGAEPSIVEGFIAKVRSAGQ